MSEMISPVANNTPGIFLLNTMTREVSRGSILEHFRVVREDGKDVLVNVEMKINGVEVDFSKSVTEMWERLSSQFDEKVLEKAKELVSESRFEKLDNIMKQAEDQIQAELETLFQKKFSD